MSLAGKLHPLLVHFPIALVLSSAAAELAAIRTRRAGWHALAVDNLRAGAAMAVVAVIAGWALAEAPFIEASSALELHRWTGVAATAATSAAVFASRRSDIQSRRSVRAYRGALFGAAVLIAIAGHLGAALVWGAEFLTK